MTDLHTAIKDLRDALIDEGAGNDRVRDCAFEVVETTCAADDERTPTQATAEYLTRLLSNLDAHMAETCRRAAAGDAGVVPAFKRTLLELDAQVARFLRTEDVQRRRRRLHGALEQAGMTASARSMTLADRAAKLGLRVETEPHGVGAAGAGYTVFRGGKWLSHGTEAEAHAFLDGYGTALTLRGCP